MNRTGTSSANAILKIAQHLEKSEILNLAGLHAYDGHIHDSDIYQRSVKCENSELFIAEIISQLSDQNIKINTVVAGGTPTLFHHKEFDNRELGAGTPVLWDHGYGSAYPELNFEMAAVVASRIISKPSDKLICLDLGYKAIASEMSWPRAYFPQFPEAQFVSHSEEHLVLEVADHNHQVGDVVYAFPTHICPTVALHDEFQVVENHEIIDKWLIEARKRKITI